MTTTDAGPEVDVYIPTQRRAATFHAGAHADTRVAELLDPHNYCRACGHCLCPPCQEATEKEN